MASKLESIKKACEINDIIFKEIINNFNFRTEKDVDNYIKKRFKQFKVKQAYKPIIANNYSKIHPVPRNKKLTGGFLLLDFGCKYNNYCSDMTRTIFLGNPNKEEIKLYNLVLDCNKKCISKLKVNLSYADLDLYSRTLLKEYKQFFLHSLGHGVGIKIHESPRIFVISQEKVKNDDIITIEPGVYFKKGNKEVGIRVEDVVHIGNKVNILTKSPKNLIAIKNFK